jgi:hypothetical protein
MFIKFVTSNLVKIFLFTKFKFLKIFTKINDHNKLEKKVFNLVDLIGL